MNVSVYMKWISKKAETCFCRFETLLCFLYRLKVLSFCMKTFLWSAFQNQFNNKQKWNSFLCLFIIRDQFQRKKNIFIQTSIPSSSIFIIFYCVSTIQRLQQQQQSKYFNYFMDRFHSWCATFLKMALHFMDVHCTHILYRVCGTLFLHVCVYAYTKLYW